jgi:hypothetical protein
VIQAADAGLVVADILRADESRATGDGIGGGTRQQMIVRAARSLLIRNQQVTCSSPVVGSTFQS